MANRIQVRRDTAANWTAANPVLAAGETGLETDTKRRKTGDGATAWTALPYVFDKTIADGIYTTPAAANAAYAPITGSANYLAPGQLDAANAANITTPASATAAALNAAYAPSSLVTSISKRATNRVVFAGDSITASAGTGVGYLAMASAAALGLYPAGTIGPIAQAWLDAGVPGNTSTQLLARFDTDVIAKAPRLVHILIGTNDAGAAAPVSTLAANIKAMVAKCRAIGAQIILATVPPNGTGTPTNRKALIVAYNQWICRYAIANNFPVADYYRVLVDTTTGGYQTAYDSGDGTHPSPAGIGVMAAELVAAIPRPLSSALLLTKDANDPCNYARNALWLSGWGTGWSNPVVAGCVASTVSGDTNIQGNWGKLAATATAAVMAPFQNQTTTQGGAGLTAGNNIMLGFRAQSSALSTAQTFSSRIRTTNGNYDIRVATQRIVYTSPGGLIYLNEGPASPGLTYLQSYMELAPGTGDVSYAQFTAYDLTAMGVTDVSGNLI